MCGMSHFALIQTKAVNRFRYSHKKRAAECNAGSVTPRSLVKVRACGVLCRYDHSLLSASCLQHYISDQLYALCLSVEASVAKSITDRQ
jgi:hypothetical protein